MTNDKQSSDVCLILEGTYPYVAGGVSSWTHELIQNHPELTFALVCLIPRDAPLTKHYEIPDNVTELVNLRLQELPEAQVKASPSQKRHFYPRLHQLLERLVLNNECEAWPELVALFSKNEGILGRDLLIKSHEIWDIMISMYEKSMPETSFLDFFWSWMSLLSGLFSILVAPLPKASCYHALCTGYAGAYMARAHAETGRPGLLTEHGIYTNERRIEIAAADWLLDQLKFTMSVDHSYEHRELRQFWNDMFALYAKLCYRNCSQVITLFEGNRQLQVSEGAPADKTRVIPNGIDYEHYAAITRTPDHPPTIALIGRVVPIKDVKTFIRSAMLVHRTIPSVQVLILGSTDEDPDYYGECQEMIHYEGLDGVVTFTGKVKLSDYLGRIDVVVLTSLSEAQPLVLLEAGAAGIPVVASNVGACREIIEGDDEEQEPLGSGGVVAPLSSPTETAQAIVRLLQDSDFYSQCSETMKKRIKLKYCIEDQIKAYDSLYKGLMAENTAEVRI